jgi:hypothetical protein
MQQKSPMSPSTSDSETESLEFIEDIRPNALPAHQARRVPVNQGIEFPTPGLTSTFMVAANTSISSPSESVLSRGRYKAKWSSKLDLTAENSEEEKQLSPVRSTTKRFLSLSPLRTLFPTKHSAPQERALSAHPAPGASPYSAPADTSCFRSTTSLATSRLPFGNSTSMLTTLKPESIRSSSKRLFHIKAKEKERERDKERGKGKNKSDFDEVSDESLDSWEILDKELEKEDDCRAERESQSLMAVIVPPADVPSSPTISPQVSPTRSVSFTYGTSTPIALSYAPSSQASTEPPTPSWNEPHPLSLRDIKVAEAIEPFLRRQPKKAGHHKAKTTPKPIIIPSSPRGPLVTTVRSKLNHAYNSNDQSIADTSGHDGWEEWSNTTAIASESDIGSVAGQSTHDLWQALETPLPSSSMQMTLSPPPVAEAPARRPPSPSSIMLSVSSPTTPMATHAVALYDGRRGEHNQPSPDKTPKITEAFNSPSWTSEYTGSTPYASYSGHTSFPPSPATSNPRNIMPPSPQSGRHHYVGRPLPRPPQTLQPPRHAAVDSIYAVASGSPDSSSASIPEGLLIDLENEAEVDVSGSWTPPGELLPSSAPMTPRRLSPVTSSGNTPEPSIRSMNTTGNVSSLSSLSEMTDLDLLAAALADNSGRADYEVRVGFDINPFLPNG